MQNLQKEYDMKKMLYNHFVRWAERGIWENIFTTLAGSEGERNQL